MCVIMDNINVCILIGLGGCFTSHGACVITCYMSGAGWANVFMCDYVTSYMFVTHCEDQFPMGQ